ncbi:hypothetical protein [Duganella sp. Root336D2]|uniref:hypothetical protein n=1 Tax=Duganella sp. Root336D2 TaxID=1736518 RepID=UPI0027D77BCB|nr:hypothetical protein [Duganella sp. Root336D2]
MTTLNYDGEGNLTEKKQGSDSTIYRYNGNDNLISVARNGTMLGRYSNDHLGLRIEKEAKDPLQPGAPPVKLRTLWDGRNAFQDRDSGGEVIARYDNDGRHRRHHRWQRQAEERDCLRRLRQHHRGDRPERQQVRLHRPPDGCGDRPGVLPGALLRPAARPLHYARPV